MKRVAVEANLTNVEDYLRQQGYQVMPLRNTNDHGNYDAIVITGGSKNMMGMQDIIHNCPVINAEGLTAEQIYQRLEQIPS